MLMENGTRDLTDYKALARDVAKGTLLVIDTDGGRVEATAQDTIAGLFHLLTKAGEKIGSLERRLLELDDPASIDSHPSGKDIRALFERWRIATHRAKSTKLGKGRTKLIKGRIADGFPVTSKEPLPSEPTLELALDGIAAYPFRQYADRFKEGKDADRDTEMDAALGDEKRVEQASRLGYKARKAGWDPVTGWPEEKEK